MDEVKLLPCAYVLGPISDCDDLSEDGGQLWQAEVQTMGGYGVAATIYAGTEEAARQMAEQAITAWNTRPTTVVTGEHQSTGVSPSGSGHSAEPEPSSTVSAVPASVPNAALVAELRNLQSIAATNGRYRGPAGYASGEELCAISAAGDALYGLLPRIIEEFETCRLVIDTLDASAIPSRRADDAEGGSAGTEGSAVAATSGETPLSGLVTGEGQPDE